LGQSTSTWDLKAGPVTTPGATDGPAFKQVEPKGKNVPAIAEETKLMLVRLELPPDVQRKFRVEASREGLSMAKMARRLVEEWTAKRTEGAK
jgi:hypothetical protein